jgi:serine/threonine-protein kinase
MATVYLAHDRKLHRAVALKVLRPELAASLGAERFLREIEIAARLTHPNILALHDCGAADGLLYYTMPYVEGESLRDRLDREKQLPFEDALQITREVADALGYAHSLGLVHRDIKPENILFTAGHAVVSDFGIARAVSSAAGARLTETGLAVGTPAYMSPEQAAGDQDIDARSDLYSLGCVLYEMLGGETPYTAPTPQALIAKKLSEPLPRISVVREAVPPGIETALTKALARTPADRFATAQQFVEALTAEVVVARVGGSRWPLSAVAAALIAVVIVAAWFLSTVLGGPAYERLAVLPPANLMNDPEQEYFVAGMHNALISELQKAGVAVIGRTSVMRYQNTQMLAREIAQELGVDALIEASVMRAGDSVEIEVRLVDGTTQQAVADPIVRRSALRDVERLYRGLTAAIASEIQAALTPQAEAFLASARPVNPQAYEAYLKGVSQWHAAHISRALEYFQQALSLDSTYAPAQAGVARVWWWRATTGRAPERAQARVTMHQALALDSTLAEVQWVVAMIRAWLDWDWEGAEAAFRKAIEINPSYAEARAFYAGFLYTMERPEEGRAQMEIALQLDPLNLMSRALNGGLLNAERRYAEAIEELEAVLRIEPNHVVAKTGLIDAYHATGNYDEALAMVRRLMPSDQELQVALEEALDRGYAEGGYRTAMLRRAEIWAAHPEASEGRAIDVVMSYALAGERERTLEWLEVAYQAQHYQLPGILPASGLGPVPGDDPRYLALRRRMNLPQ